MSGRTDLGARLRPALTACIKGVRAAHLVRPDLDAGLTRGQWSLDLDRHDLLDAYGLGQINRADVTVAWARPLLALRLTRTSLGG